MASVLLYDAGCWFCHLCREWLQLRFDPEALQFADANDATVAQRLGIGDTEQLHQRMCLVRRDGARFWGYDAMRELAREAHALDLARVMGWGTLRRTGQRVYDWVAAHRTCAARAKSAA